MRKVFGYGLTFFSLLAGLFVYLICRDKANPFYQWAIYFDINEEVNFTRNLVANFQIPSWIVYSLPDGLWMFSFVLFMMLTWDLKFSGRGKFWIICSFLVGIIFEISQAFISDMGVFDWFDLLFILGGTILALLFYTKQKFYEKIF